LPGQDGSRDQTGKKWQAVHEAEDDPGTTLSDKSHSVGSLSRLAA
jgi:hypothetical protein